MNSSEDNVSTSTFITRKSSSGRPEMQQLKPAYDPPSHTSVSNTILNSENAQITIKINEELQKEENITIVIPIIEIYTILYSWLQTEENTFGK
nr:6186_t:CDS:2 [Entrophospora candida]